jgi:hypothetical protein
VRQPHLPGTGYIRWDALFRNGFRTTGEGGCWVYAFWPAAYDHPQPRPDAGLSLVANRPEDTVAVVSTVLTDRFVRCHGVEHTIGLPLPDAPLSPNAAQIYPPEAAVEYAGPTADPDRRDRYLHYMENAGTPVLAAVCLGSDARAWANHEGYWWACRKDLTWRGRLLLQWLDRLYRRRAHLVTFLDT